MFKNISFRDPVVWVALLAGIYLAVLPMSGTIALRRLAMVLLLLVLFWQFWMSKSIPKLPIPIALWAAYLLLFPLISSDPTAAWESLGKQWGMGLLAMIAGAGAASLLSRYRWGTSFHLGILSCITILVHLYLFSYKAWETSSIPWNYWGRETHHADLGYAAGQAVILLAASLLFNKKASKFIAIFLILACLASTALARSRAGLAFSVFGGILVFSTATWSRSTAKKAQVLKLLGGLLLIAGVVIGIAANTDTRWRNMESNMTSGWLGDALQIQCAGTASVEQQIVEKYGVGEESARVIASVKDGDGSRVVLLRAGVALMLKNPWGIDGSRQSYKKLLRQECPNPAIEMAHAHNGWIDTALAIGWVGAILYMVVLFGFARFAYGYIQDKTQEVSTWAIVLFSMSIFWTLRAFTDSVYRDHMFEMQGFVLTYAYISLRQYKDITVGRPGLA